jgi:SAM-dependent methyltransferase
MSQTDRVFTGSIPALYDHHRGPLIFEPYAVDLADRLARMTESDVLETAAGTGIVTRALARTLVPEIRITATDLNQPMLDFAVAQGGASRVTWRQADALRLPFMITVPRSLPPAPDPVRTHRRAEGSPQAVDRRWKCRDHRSRPAGARVIQAPSDFAGPLHESHPTSRSRSRAAVFFRTRIGIPDGGVGNRLDASSSARRRTAQAREAESWSARLLHSAIDSNFSVFVATYESVGILSPHRVVSQRR